MEYVGQNDRSMIFMCSIYLQFFAFKEFSSNKKKQEHRVYRPIVPFGMWSVQRNDGLTSNWQFFSTILYRELGFEFFSQSDHLESSQWGLFTPSPVNIRFRKIGVAGKKDFSRGHTIHKMYNIKKIDISYHLFLLLSMCRRSMSYWLAKRQLWHKYDGMSSGYNFLFL